MTMTMPLLLTMMTLVTLTLEHPDTDHCVSSRLTVVPDRTWPEKLPNVKHDDDDDDFGTFRYRSHHVDSV